MSWINYMIQKLRIGIITAVISLGMFFILNILKYGIYYIVGFLSGCLNFMLLILSISIVTNGRYKKPLLMQRLLLIIRYLIVINILLGIAGTDAFDIILFCAGLLSVNFSIILTFYKFRFNTKEEE